MARLIDPRTFRGGYKGVRNALGKNTEIAKKIRRVEDWKTITEGLNKADYKSKGTARSVKKFIGDAMKGRVSGIDRSEAMALAHDLTGGKYIITPDSIKPPRVEQVLNKTESRPASHKSPIIDRVMGNIAAKKNVSDMAGAKNMPSVNSFARPNMGNMVRSQRGIGSIGVSARPSGVTKR